jgi:hypothetical protein
MAAKGNQEEELLAEPAEEHLQFWDSKTYGLSLLRHPRGVLCRAAWSNGRRVGRG